MRRRAALGIRTLPLILFGMSVALLQAQFTNKAPGTIDRNFALFL